jgi:hypothetical protein
MTLSVTLAVGAPAATITIFTVSNLSATRDLAAGQHDGLIIRLRGYQWWREATYVDSPHWSPPTSCTFRSGRR